MRKSKFTESRIIKAIKANENGQRVEDLCRELGIRPATFWEADKKFFTRRVTSISQCLKRGYEFNRSTASFI